jgi:hypothetical protein
VESRLTLEPLIWLPAPTMRVGAMEEVMPERAMEAPGSLLTRTITPSPIFMAIGPPLVPAYEIVPAPLRVTELPAESLVGTLATKA